MKRDSSEWLAAHGYPLFELGDDGFPRPGKVLKHYRYLKKKDDGTPWTQSDLGYVLGISAQAVRDMENRDIGFSIERRRFLAKLFDIPPALLGIVTAEELLQRLAIQKKDTIPTFTKQAHIDTQDYQATLQAHWNAHHSRAAHHTAQDILARISTLEGHIPLLNGQQKIHLIELASQYHQLIAMILRDLQQFDDALAHLNKAVQFATYAKENTELLAIASYRRGVVALDKERVLHDSRALLTAHHDFEFALTLRKRIPPSLLNALLLKGGHTQTRIAKREEELLQGLKMMEQAGSMARILKGDDHSYHFKTDVAHYHIEKGAALLAIGRPKDAITELSLASEKPDFTRRNLYRDILLAQAYIDTGDYLYALSLTDAALSIAKDINSSVNVARIKNIYTQVISPSCPCKNNPEVARLGYRLKSHIFS